MEVKTNTTKNVGFIDIGTNSIRLALVQIAPNGAYTIISDQKETVRLGEGVFDDNYLTRDAIARSVLVCSQFAEMARNNSAEQIIAVATAATREAKNRSVFINALKESAQLDVKPISGIEEARLIYLGVADGFDMQEKTALMIDIGGGSTELIVGDQKEYYHLDSMKLGAIRITSKFFSPNDSGPISKEKFLQIKKFVQNTAIRPIQRTKEYHFDITIGSSGTIENLLNIASYLIFNKSYSNGDTIQTKDLLFTIEHLCSLSLEERANIQGISNRRADIIIGGAAVLLTILEELNIPGLYSTQRTLRDGMLVDYLTRTEHAPLFEMSSVQHRSVIQLAKKCGVDEPHSHHVKKLALDLFDSARKLKLHNLSDHYKQLLGYAAILHDVGIFLSYSDHHKHSYYLVKNADLVGFNQNEISIIAAATYFHRNKFPKNSRPQLSGLSKKEKWAVKILSTIIRVAEALDRSHQAVIHTAFFSPMENGKIYLNLYADNDCQLELWRLNNHNKVFKNKFVVRVFDENKNLVPIKISDLNNRYGKKFD